VIEVRARPAEGPAPAVRAVIERLGALGAEVGLLAMIHVQNRAKPRRCHAITVAGRTIASTSVHRDQMRDSRTQKARSRRL
jgi:hypothetical protein